MSENLGILKIAKEETETATLWAGKDYTQEDQGI
jgi:hypothetical protein